MFGDTEETMKLLEEFALANTSQNNFLKIKYVLLEYQKGFKLTKESKYNQAKSIFTRADAISYHHFKVDSFEFHFSQLFAISAKSYLEFKLKDANRAISLTERGIEYAILLQECNLSNNIIGLFIAQMLQNLAKIHLILKNIEKWSEITLQNIHFLSNFEVPLICKGFDIAKLEKAPTHLRHIKILAVLDEALNSIVKFNVSEGYQLIESINIKDKTNPLVKSIDIWIKLNTDINKKRASTDSFITEYQRFIASRNDTFDLQILKAFLKKRIEKEKIQLYEIA